MVKHFILYSLILFLSACTSFTVPPEPKVSLPKNTKIALLVNTSSDPKHTHIGATPFASFTKKYPYNWDMQNEIFNIFKNELEKIQDYKVVDLRSYGVETLEHGLVTIKNNQWTYSKTYTDLAQTLKDDGVKLVIHVKEQPTYFTSDCSAYSCITYYSEGLGLLSRSVLGVKSYYASASFNISAELLDPIFDISSHKEMGTLNNHRIKHKSLSNFAKPKEFENLTEKEFEDVKQGVFGQIRFFAKDIYYYLNSKL